MILAHDRGGWICTATGRRWPLDADRNLKGESVSATSPRIGLRETIEGAFKPYVAHLAYFDDDLRLRITVTFRAHGPIIYDSGPLETDLFAEKGKAKELILEMRSQLPRAYPLEPWSFPENFEERAL